MNQCVLLRSTNSVTAIRSDYNVAAETLRDFVLNKQRIRNVSSRQRRQYSAQPVSSTPDDSRVTHTQPENGYNISNPYGRTARQRQANKV